MNMLVFQQQKWYSNKMQLYYLKYSLFFSFFFLACNNLIISIRDIG